MQDIKWHIELLRIGITVVSVIVAVVLFGTKLDKNISLNQQAIQTNQEAIEKIVDNHLPHIEQALDEVKTVLYQVKTLVTNQVE